MKAKEHHTMITWAIKNQISSFYVITKLRPSKENIYVPNTGL